MTVFHNIDLVVFDWGNTLMIDFPDEVGPMYTWKKIALIEGVDEILPYLRKKNYTLAVATNAGLSHGSDVQKALKRVHIAQFFSYIFTSRDLGYKKPDPLFFEIILKMVCITPNHAVMIGDNYEKDIVGAAHVGMHTVLFFPNYHESISFPKADFVIRNMKEIALIL
ncbi:MAG: HAD-IIIA family hydrolase [Bacteroidales bacterium]|nr:HAD-IIIA family hydrolase [Bacteroidales bacterium]